MLAMRLYKDSGDERYLSFKHRWVETNKKTWEGRESFHFWTLFSVDWDIQMAFNASRNNKKALLNMLKQIDFGAIDNDIMQHQVFSPREMLFRLLIMTDNVDKIKPFCSSDNDNIVAYTKLICALLIDNAENRKSILTEINIKGFIVSGQLVEAEYLSMMKGDEDLHHKLSQWNHKKYGRFPVLKIMSDAYSKMLAQ
jgi:hypothetical protein